MGALFSGMAASEATKPSSTASTDPGTSTPTAGSPFMQAPSWGSVMQAGMGGSGQPQQPFQPGQVSPGQANSFAHGMNNPPQWGNLLTFLQSLGKIGSNNGQK